MNPDDLVDAAAALRGATHSGTPIAPLSATYPHLGVDDAYEVQLINLRNSDGTLPAVRGYKVGLTAKAMQEMLGVDEPDYGHLLPSMFFEAGSAVAVDQFLQPRVEIEIAFLLRDALLYDSRVPGAPLSIDQVLAATEAVAPAIEIIDSRIADWKITLADTIADNASSAGVVLGEWVPLAHAPPLDEIAATLVKNDTAVATGRGADVLGHPAAAVAWVATKLRSLGATLEAGHVVMPGSCTKAIDVVAGDHIRGEFAGLGHVEVTFR